MYINLETLEYPVSERDIRAQNPNTSYPASFPVPEGYAYVFPSPVPPFNQYLQYAKETTPELTDLGHYEQRWEVLDLDQSTIDASILNLKTEKNSQINADRLAANFTTFIHQGKEIACDQLSRSDIDGTNGFVSLYGSLPPGWPGGWKAVDNTYVVISTVADWKGLYSSMFAAGNANFAKAQTLKAQLALAQTAEEIQSIIW